MFRGIQHRASGGEIHRLRPGHRRERRGEQQPPGRAIQRIGEAVLVEMHQRPDALSVHRQIGQNHRAGGVVVPVVVRRELIRPHQSSVLRLARQHAGAPLVVSESLLRVIGRGVARAVIDEIELRIVGDRSPHRSAAGVPAVIGPTARTQVNTAVVRRFEGTRSGEHVLVRSDVVRGPDRAPALQIQALDPSVDPELTARCADDDAVPDHQGRHGHGLPIAHVGDLRAPQFPAGARLDRHGVPVEQVIDDLSVGVEGAAIDGVATGDPDGVRAHVRPIFPPQRISLLGEIECVQHVWPRRDDIHGVADHQRLALVSSENTRREGPHRMERAGILPGDSGEAAVAGRSVVLGRHRPLAILAGRRLGACSTDTIGIDGACTEAAKHRDERCPRHLRPLLPLWFRVSVGRRTAQVKTPYAPAAV